jgi:hypothetical protein
MLMDAWARTVLQHDRVVWADFVGLDAIANSFLMREGPREEDLDQARADRPRPADTVREPRDGDCS